MPVIKVGQVYSNEGQNKDPFVHYEVEILDVKVNFNGEVWVKYQHIFPERIYTTASGKQCEYTSSWDDFVEEGFYLKEPQANSNTDSNEGPQ